MNEFETLGLAGGLLSAIEKQGFKEPTLIQKKTIPLVLDNKDVIAGSATGSGKTLAFGAIIQNITKGAGLQALILSPTRELTMQIMDALKLFSSWKGLRVSAIYGGVSLNPQVSALAKSEIIVGTPGRMLDHTERGTIDYSAIKHVVLDEADRMLDMGFIDDVKRILSFCPKERQTLLFSATIYPEITALAQQFMHEPIKVSAETYVDPKKLTQVYYEVAGPLKFSLLVHLIKSEKVNGLSMIFCNSRRMVDTVEKNLHKQKISAMAIHGGLTQNRRSGVLDSFHHEKTQVLVCTDVAARGLDIPQVARVYNYDIPADGKSYVHRIGRTARAGKDGKVINLLSQRDHPNFSRVLYENDFEVKKVQKPFIEQIKTDLNRSSKRPEHRGQRQFDRRDDRARERPKDNRFNGSRYDSRSRDSRQNSNGYSDNQGPKRRFGSDFPRTARNNRNSFGSDSPRTANGSFSGDSAKKRFDDRPRRNFTARSHNGPRDNERSKRSFGSKGRDGFKSDEKHRNTFDNRSENNVTTNSVGRTKRTSSANKSGSRFTDKPARFNNRGGARGQGKSRQRSYSR